MEKSIEVYEKETRAGSVRLAQGLGRDHKTIKNLIGKYREDFLYFGELPKNKLESTGGRPVAEYMLNLNQMLFLFTVMRNTTSANTVTASIIKHGDIIKAFEIIKGFDVDNVPCRFVYAAMDEQGRIKIGISQNPKERLKFLNIGNADNLELVFTKQADKPGYQSEIMLHEKCASFHIRSEWFKPEALEAISCK